MTMFKKRYILEKKIYAQVRYYETLFKIKDQSGEVIFTGSEEMAKRLIKILERDAIGIAKIDRLKRKAKK